MMTGFRVRLESGRALVLPQASVWPWRDYLASLNLSEGISSLYQVTGTYILV